MAGLQSEIGMGCSGICKQYKAEQVKWEPRYSNGQKRCRKCEIFMKYDGLKCPCCNTKLLTRPKSMTDKLKTIPKKLYQ